MDDRTKGLLGALGSYSQADMDGIMCEVSRQAVEEAADLIKRQAAELERLNADRQLQAKLLLAAHRMLMAAGLGPSSKDYLDQWAFIRDAELERLRACMKWVKVSDRLLELNVWCVARRVGKHPFTCRWVELKGSLGVYTECLDADGLVRDPKEWRYIDAERGE